MSMFESDDHDTNTPPATGRIQEVCVEEKGSRGASVLSKRNEKQGSKTLDDVDVVFARISHQESQHRTSTEEDERVSKNDMDYLNRRIERKRFMSSNPDTILSMEPRKEDVRGPAKRSAVYQGRTEREEFRAMAREIQAFGTISCCIDVAWMISRDKHTRIACEHGGVFPPSSHMPSS